MPGQPEGANYDRLSPAYDRLAEPHERRLRSDALGMLAVRPGQAVLELGCGTGRALSALAMTSGAHGRVVGIDLSAGMLKTAGLHLAGLPEQQCSASLVRADVRHLAFPNEYFDAIYTGFTLELFSDPEITLVLNECRRVLRGSGRLCVLHMANPSHGGIMSRAYRWTHARFPGWVDCRPIDLSGPLRAAGFHQQEVRHASLWGLPVDLCLAT